MLPVTPTRRGGWAVGTESGGRTRTRLAPHQGLNLVRLPKFRHLGTWRMLKGSNLRDADLRALPVFETGALPLGQACARCAHRVEGHGREESNLRQAVLETAALPQLDRISVSGQDGWFRATDLVLPTHARYLCATS